MNPYLTKDIWDYIIRNKYNNVIEEYIGAYWAALSYDGMYRRKTVRLYNLPNDSHTIVFLTKIIENPHTNIPQFNKLNYRDLDKQKNDIYNCKNPYWTGEPFDSIYNGRDIEYKPEIYLPRKYVVTYPHKSDLLKILPEDWRFGNYNFMGKLKDKSSYYEVEKNESISHGGYIRLFCKI